MLGVKEIRRPVTGEFVNVVRDSLRRALTGDLTQKERECAAREKEIEKQYNIVWK